MLDAGHDDPIVQRGIDEALACQDKLARANQTVPRVSDGRLDCRDGMVDRLPPDELRAANNPGGPAR